MKLFPLKIHEYCFLFTGIGILVSLPWLEMESWSLVLWTLAKVSYFAGIVFFVVNTIKEVK